MPGETIVLPDLVCQMGLAFVKFGRIGHVVLNVHYHSGVIRTGQQNLAKNRQITHVQSQLERMLRHMVEIALVIAPASLTYRDFFHCDCKQSTTSYRDIRALSDNADQRAESSARSRIQLG